MYGNIILFSTSFHFQYHFHFFQTLSILYVVGAVSSPLLQSHFNSIHQHDPHPNPSCWLRDNRITKYGSPTPKPQQHTTFIILSSAGVVVVVGVPRNSRPRLTQTQSEWPCFWRIRQTVCFLPSKPYSRTRRDMCTSPS